MRYPEEKMAFLGVDQADLTRDFEAVDGFEIESGVVKIGGYGIRGIQDEYSGILLELHFQVMKSGGKLEIFNLVDDLEGFSATR